MSLVLLWDPQGLNMLPKSLPNLRNVPEEIEAFQINLNKHANRMVTRGLASGVSVRVKSVTIPVNSWDLLSWLGTMRVGKHSIQSVFVTKELFFDVDVHDSYLEINVRGCRLDTRPLAVWFLDRNKACAWKRSSRAPTSPTVDKKMAPVTICQHYLT